MWRLLLVSVFLFSVLSFAEPWLGNRVSQNCAACHAPNRRNVEFEKRRCTLSCQGCHVNPSGGGLRSQYGKWYQQRWLNSFRSDHLEHKKKPAPLPAQRYAKQPKSFKGKRVPTKWKLYAVRGPRLVTTDKMSVEEDKYDYSYKEYEIVATLAEFLMRVPSDDPYRLERRQLVTAGGDFRYLYLNQEVKRDGTTVSETESGFPMAFDLGVQAKPIKEHFSLVFESRFLNGPNNPNLEDIFTTQARVRSAYALVDGLPFNSYVQYGLYRPRFGHYDPDHTALAQDISGLDQRSVFRAFTIGASPNIPFINLHFIQKIPNENYSQDEGGVLNIGGNWVTLGASVMYSYWLTKAPNAAGVELETEKHSLTGGMKLWDFILRAEYLNVSREFAVDAIDRGNVYTANLKYRFWRENYLQASYAVSDVTRSLSEGEAQEVMVGTKHFLFPGSHFEFLFVDTQEVLGSGSSSVEVKGAGLRAQAHFYF